MALALDEMRWETRYNSLIRGKRHVGSHVAAAPTALRRYHTARREPARLDLCAAELASFEWCMRFKSNRGPQFMELDPWWNGDPGQGGTLKLKLRADQVVVPLRPAESHFWGPAGQEAGHWEFRVHPEEKSSEVRVNGFPSLLLSRHPEHWGVFLQSDGVLLTAFEMAPKGCDPCMEDEALEAGLGSARNAYLQSQMRRYRMRGNAMGFDEY